VPYPWSAAAAASKRVAVQPSPRRVEDILALPVEFARPLGYHGPAEFVHVLAAGAAALLIAVLAMRV
jgi:hypothetical protein